MPTHNMVDAVYYWVDAECADFGRKFRFCLVVVSDAQA